MSALRKVFNDLSITPAGLTSIDMIAAEIERLQNIIREKIIDNIAQINEERKLSKKEIKVIQKAIIDDYVLTGADLILD